MEDAINAILEPALNTTVKFMMVSYADHTEKINLVLASGDKLDLYEPFQSYDNFYANGYMMDISGYGEYYKDIAELLGEGYMECAQIDGVQYGLPSPEGSGPGYLRHLPHRRAGGGQRGCERH